MTAAQTASSADSPEAPLCLTRGLVPEPGAATQRAGTGSTCSGGCACCWGPGGHRVLSLGLNHRNGLGQAAEPQLVEQRSLEARRVSLVRLPDP